MKRVLVGDVDSRQLQADGAFVVGMFRKKDLSMLLQAKQGACFPSYHARVVASPSPIPSGDQYGLDESSAVSHR